MFGGFGVFGGQSGWFNRFRRGGNIPGGRRAGFGNNGTRTPATTAATTATADARSGRPGWI